MHFVDDWLVLVAFVLFCFFFYCCQTLLTRPNRVETAVHGCNSWFSLWTLSCISRCDVKFSA